MQQTSHLPPRLDSLPPELLLAILAHLPPPHISLGSGSPPSQRNALFAVQRTSKRLCAVCTPILWDGLEMDIGPGARGETWRVVAQLRASRERALACRKLRLEAFDWEFLPPFESEGERLLPNVEDVELYQTMPATLDVVARFRKTRRLAIEYAELLSAPSQVTFAHLERMSLADVTIHLPSSRSTSFFDTSILPSLRQLRLGRIYVEPSMRDDDDDGGGGASVFSPALVRQLDQLHLELSGVYSLCDGVLPVVALTPDAPVMWHFKLGEWARPFVGLPPPRLPVSFLYATLSEHWLDEITIIQLRGLLAVHTYLRLVLVPRLLWRHGARRSSPADEPGPVLGAIVAECAARGTAVRAYDAERERDGFVPSEAAQFWREEGVGRV
ncbi:hypothetical protein JCM8208_004337 [Rhodotorula glutinis]